jgi:hypothetical protein
MKRSIVDRRESVAYSSILVEKILVLVYKTNLSRDDKFVYFCKISPMD